MQLRPGPIDDLAHHLPEVDLAGGDLRLDLGNHQILFVPVGFEHAVNELGKNLMLVFEVPIEPTDAQARTLGDVWRLRRVEALFGVELQCSRQDPIVGGALSVPAETPSGRAGPEAPLAAARVALRMRSLAENSARSLESEKTFVFCLTLH